MSEPIIIPSKVASTQPKPTKAQIVEALVSRARENHKNEEVRKEKVREHIQEKAEALIRGHIKNLREEDFDVNHFLDWSRDREVRVTASFQLAGMAPLKSKWGKNQKSFFDEKAVKAKIVEKLKPSNPLMENDEVVKALDAMLANIFNTTLTIEA